MFDLVKKSLYEKKDVLPEEKDAREQFVKEHTTFSGNGSIKLSTSGDPFVDDFMAIASYRSPRDIKDVFETMRDLWSIDPITCLKESVYLRLITRDTRLFEGAKLKVQRGQGLKHEFLCRIMWLAVYHPDTFKKNLPLFIAAGSWDDLFELMRMDLSYEHDGNKYKRALDWKFIGSFIAAGLKDEGQCNLIKKFLPQIKAAKYCSTKRSQCNNYIAKWVAKLLFSKKGESEAVLSKPVMYGMYRELKTSGTAHQWQQLISWERFNEIDFDKIPGRALSILSNSEFLANHGLEEEFYNWVMSKPQAKFTGFVYELFKPVSKEYQKELINRQFMSLIETAKKDVTTKTDFICCLDTSCSMSSPCFGLPNSTSLAVAQSICLYFSFLLEGKFSKGYLAFSSGVTMEYWKGDSPYDMFMNGAVGGYGNTNFLGVADFLVSAKQTFGIDEDQFPKGVICISDEEFDYYSGQFDSVFKEFKRRLSAVFSEDYVNNFKLVLWDIPNTFYGRDNKTAPKFESLADEPNFFYMSGFDPAGITFLTGKTPQQKEVKTAKELFDAAMNQELLGMLRI